MNDSSIGCLLTFGAVLAVASVALMVACLFDEVPWPVVLVLVVITIIFSIMKAVILKEDKEEMEKRAEQLSAMVDNPNCDLYETYRTGGISYSEWQQMKGDRESRKLEAVRKAKELREAAALKWPKIFTVNARQQQWVTDNPKWPAARDRTKITPAAEGLWQIETSDEWIVKGFPDKVF